MARVDVAALRGRLDGHRDEMVADLVAYAEHETPSDDRALLAAGLAHVEGWVADRLGTPASRTRHGSAEHGDVLVLQLDGAGERPLTLLAHYDTVWSAGTLADWPVRIDGDRLTGPGVFDMKAGLVQAVWAVRALRAAGLPHPPLRLLLNGDEEIGSPFSRPLIEKACADAAAVLVFEAAADGAVKTARKGVGLWDVRVRGVESHAGLDPAAGASAIDELARVVRTLHDATDPDAGTNVNVGVVRGGTRSNVVAGAAEAGVDVRVRTTAEQARIDALMAGLRAHDPRAEVTPIGGWNRPVMERSPAIAAVYALARAAAAQIGVDLAETAVGGASDGNFAAALGRPVLDGLGAVGAGAHARHEHVSIDGMVERAAVAAGVIAAFAQ
ncbi:M20 family metallopeptidase [Pseudonocardia sp. K10HN5]|uniref:M20 family metallopeptidase n=2 Tax=Pseudonocardia acidicola TaxID=2724939 RepID=A0ABX1S5J1_9PSEU|nr:M20 family metallopeptidase [Pseudonocardia acidicola]NMH96849.1 M20 family metallopeptidase [Pseudonocardia acidicola]